MDAILQTPFAEIAILLVMAAVIGLLSILLGFSGRIAAASHSSGDREALFGAGVDLVLEPFQDAADRAAELLCGAAGENRTALPAIAAEGREPG